MAKKIVLSVTNDTYTDQRVHKMARKLNSMGYIVYIIGKWSKQKISQPDYARIKRLRVLFKKSAFFYAEYNMKLFFYLLFSKLSILTANDLDTLPANALVAVLRRKKLVYDSHEFFTESPEIVNRKWLQKFWKFVEKICIKAIDHGLTVSRPIAEAYKSTYNKDFIVVRNLPERYIDKDINTKLPECFDFDKIVIYQGSLNLGRGLELAIDAFSLINDIRFIIIGCGDVEAQLKERVKQKDLSQKVFFTGRIAPEILPFYTSRATIGISIEEKLGKNYEFALPNKVFDYINAGVPVIVSELPEMQKIVDNYKVGLVLRDYSVKGFADMVQNVFNSVDKLAELKQNCIKASEELYWEKESRIIEDIYNS